MKNITIEDMKNNLGVILSYGQAQDIIPVGVFKVNKFIFLDKTPLDSDISDSNETLVELVRVKQLEEDNDSKEKVYIPIKEFYKLYDSSINCDNKDLFYEYTDYEPYLDGLLDLEYVIDLFLKDNYGNYEAYGKSLEELKGTYIREENIMGTNYTLMPFPFNKKSKKQ